MLLLEAVKVELEGHGGRQEAVGNVFLTHMLVASGGCGQGESCLDKLMDLSLGGRVLSGHFVRPTEIMQQRHG